MIKGWNRFNESNGGRFSQDMAMEITYYFSEDSKPSKEISDLFFGYCENEGITNLWSWYESGHDEYQQGILKLYGLVQRGSLEFKDNMIEIYNRIRQSRSSFVPVIEIENHFINLIDKGYEFIMYTTDHDYKINLQKKDEPWDEFIETCNYINDILDDLKTPSCDVSFGKIERLNGFFNDGTGTYLYTYYNVYIRRKGFKKDNRSGEYTSINPN
jgi:hypothetical protein